jgi:hypothetical protein
VPVRDGVTGIFIWPQNDDQRQRSLPTASVQTTITSEALYVLTAVSVWPGVSHLSFQDPSRSVTRCAGPGLPGRHGSLPITGAPSWPCITEDFRA